MWYTLKVQKPNVYRPWYGWYTCTPPGYPPSFNHRRVIRADGLASDRHHPIRTFPKPSETIKNQPNRSEVEYFFRQSIRPSFLCTVCANLHKFAQICIVQKDLLFSPQPIDNSAHNSISDELSTRENKNSVLSVSSCSNRSFRARSVPSLR